MSSQLLSSLSRILTCSPSLCMLSHLSFREYFYFYFFLLYNIVLVLPYINMHPPRVYTCSPSWTPLPLPFPYHPSGSSQCTSPKLPVSCMEPGLAIRFLYDIIHVIMPFSQITPHLPESPKDCSIHLCLFCCLTYRVVITIFLNSIYIWNLGSILQANSSWWTLLF